MSEVLELYATGRDDIFTYQTELDGNTYEITLRWNGTTTAWFMDIEGITNDVKLYGRKLTVGHDVLRRHAILELGTLGVSDTGGKSDPDLEGFGDRFKLLYLTKE